MRFSWMLALTSFCLLAGGANAQTTVSVPADQPTIQAGIDATANGDTVLVAPGTYNERINFSGKNITVKSSGGASVTTIDGGAGGSVVTIVSGEGPGATLQGFTVQHGYSLTGVAPSNGAGGGIWIRGASSTILD